MRETFALVRWKGKTVVPGTISEMKNGNKVVRMACGFCAGEVSNFLSAIPMSSLMPLDEHLVKEYEELADFIKMLLKEFPEDIPVLHVDYESLHKSSTGLDYRTEVLKTSKFIEKLIEYMV
jgi:hypothetical protein